MTGLLSNVQTISDEALSGLFLVTELRLGDPMPATGFFPLAEVNSSDFPPSIVGRILVGEFLTLMLIDSSLSLLPRRKCIRTAIQKSSRACSNETAFMKSKPTTAKKPRIGMGNPEVASFSRSFTFLLRALNPYSSSTRNVARLGISLSCAKLKVNVYFSFA